MNIYAVGDQSSKRPNYVECLSKHYNIPIIRLREVFEYVEANCTDEELLGDLKEEIENIKNILSEGTSVTRFKDRTLD